MELDEAEGKPYRDAVIEASKKDGAWVHIVYVPVVAELRSFYPAGQFIDRRAHSTDIGKRIGTTKNFLNERGQSVECVAYTAAHQGVLYELGVPNLVTPDVDGEPVVGVTLEEAGIDPADFVTVGKTVVTGVDMAEGEDYTAQLPFSPSVPRKKRGGSG